MHWGAAGALLFVGMSSGCVRANPKYDVQGLEAAVDDDGGSESGSASTGSDEVGGDAGSAGTEPGATSGGTSAGSDEDSGGIPIPDPDDPDLMLYASLDSLASVQSPEVGVGSGMVGAVAPEQVESPVGFGLRSVLPTQWFAFPQHDGQVANIDHAAGSLSMFLLSEATQVDIGGAALFSLAGVIPDGGGLRMATTGPLEGNEIIVDYYDIDGQNHRTYYPGSVLPPGAWVRLELDWRADVGVDEHNIELWIDGEWIEPLPGSATGPMEVGPASAKDVMIFGSWLLGGGISARARFDEIEIYSGL
ncbi:MAG: hypothetical protein AAF799_33870 [Myxococcota bacterium]